MRKLFKRALSRSRASSSEESASPNVQVNRPRKGQHGLVLLNDYSADTQSSDKIYTVDIVAIHGLNGDSHKTWTHPNGMFWLQDLLPQTLPGAAIFSYGYPSEVFFSRSVATIEDFALHLLNDLTVISSKESTLRPIIYICHSLGGIVFKQAMNVAYDRYPKIWERSKGVLFFGTPHLGSSTAPTAELLGNIMNAAWSISGAYLNRGGIRTPLIKDLRLNSPRLKCIADTFAQRADHFMIESFYETEITSPIGKVVVDKRSAVIGMRHEKASPLWGDHREICRIKGKDESNYKQISTSLKEMAEVAIKELVDFNATATSILSRQSLDSTDKMCVELLSSTDVSGFQTSLDGRIEGTLTWVLQSPKCTAWLWQREKRLLWVTGYAGCGKTMLSSYMVGYLSEILPQKSLICRFFCSGKAEEQQDPNVLVRALIHQMVVQRPRLLKIIRKASELQGRRIFRQFDTLWDLFVDIVRQENIPSINIVIDAIDECDEATQVLLVGRIARFLKLEPGLCIKFFITSRPTARAVQVIEESAVDLIRLKFEDSQDLIARDINLVVKQRVELLVKRGGCPLNFRPQLEELLVSKAENTFLWVSLVLSSFEKRRVLTPSDLQNLGQLPSDLQSLYKSFLQAIPKGDRKLASDILHIIIVSARPLNAWEICIMLNEGSLDSLELKTAGPHMTTESIKILLNPLVQVRDSQILLIHHSIKEFLLNMKDDPQDTLSHQFHVDFTRQSALITRSCIYYLLGDAFVCDLFGTQPSTCEQSPILPIQGASADASPVSDSILDPFELQDIAMFKEEAVIRTDKCTDIAERFNLFDYAARYWTSHFSHSENHADTDLCGLAIQLCESSSFRLNNWFQYLQIKADVHEEYPKVLDPLIVACFFGLSNIVEYLLETTLDNLDYGLALFWAARRGYLKCLEPLSWKPISDDQTCYYMDQSPLMAAAQNGHLSCARFLLERGLFDPNEADNRGRTALSHAAGNGHTETVTLLLSEEKLQPDIPDSNGWTPLSWAIASNSVTSVRQLLGDNRVQPTILDRSNRNVISWAAEEGHIAICKALLKDGRIDANIQDTRGWTPLIYAIANGHTEVVQLLIRASGIDFSVTDSAGRNIISWAAESSDVILATLLKRYPGGADVADGNGWTPLAWALNTPGYPKNVALLLRSGLVDVNHKDHSGRSPLATAVSYGYFGITQLLLRAKGTDVNLKDAKGWTALSYAALNSSYEITKSLLDTPGVNVNATDNRGRTPLSLAAGVGRMDIFLLLLETEGVDSEIIDEEGHTALWYARRYEQGLSGHALEHVLS